MIVRITRTTLSARRVIITKLTRRNVHSVLIDELAREPSDLFAMYDMYICFVYTYTYILRVRDRLTTHTNIARKSIMTTARDPACDPR